MQLCSSYVVVTTYNTLSSHANTMPLMKRTNLPYSFQQNAAFFPPGQKTQLILTLCVKPGAMVDFGVYTTRIIRKNEE